MYELVLIDDLDDGYVERFPTQLHPNALSAPLAL